MRILQPLRERDFALLAAGSVVSLVGDGLFYVALAWQVYDLSNDPAALGIVGVASTIPLVVFTLVGGLVSDRYDRRRVLIAADLLRLVALAAMGLLAVSGRLELIHIAALAAVIGIGDAFFYPASTAIVPDLLTAEALPQANAFSGAVRPMMVRLIGPAVGGVLVATVGPGPTFLIDAATFGVSAVFVLAIRGRPTERAVQGGLRHSVGQIVEGIRFVRRRPWIWATLVSAALALLLFFGPYQVLLPYLVRNELLAGAEGLGLIFAAGGVGSIVAAVVTGQLGLPRRQITVMYLTWGLGTAIVAGFGLMTSLWQAVLISAFAAALFEVGGIIWVGLLQRLVPREMLGRVSSLDVFVAFSLVPLSYALTGPVASVMGARPTMVVMGLVGAVAMVSLLWWPGVRDPERTLQGE